MSEEKRRTKSTRRITEDDEYERPEQTITDLLQTSAEMRRKLEGYGRVTNIESIPINTHIRYITWKNGQERFTLGGKLRKVMPKYIVLYNNNFSWSVQREHFDKKGNIIFTTVFFNKLTELDQCKIALVRQQEELEAEKQENKRLREILRAQK